MPGCVRRRLPGLVHYAHMVGRGLGAHGGWNRGCSRPSIPCSGSSSCWPPPTAARRSWAGQGCRRWSFCSPICPTRWRSGAGTAPAAAARTVRSSARGPAPRRGGGRPARRRGRRRHLRHPGGPQGRRGYLGRRGRRHARRHTKLQGRAQRPVHRRGARVRLPVVPSHGGPVGRARSAIDRSDPSRIPARAPRARVIPGLNARGAYSLRYRYV